MGKDAVLVIERVAVAVPVFVLVAVSVDIPD